MRFVSVLLVAAAVSLLGCATAVTDEGPPPGQGVGGAMGGAGGSSSTTSSSSSGGTGGAGAEGGYAGSGGQGGGAGSGGSGGTCSYDHPETCTTAEPLGTIAGDADGPPRVATGQTSKWYVILVEETISAIAAEDLSYTVTLTSPPGMDYDLFVHQGPEDGDPDCSVAPIQGVEAGSTDSVHESWDDDQPFPLGEDDSRYLNIEVRHMTGTECGAAAQWTLSITGHT